jgi:hypothetical protein
MVQKLTYAALGAQLGLSAAAARMRAKRNGWRITIGNDGRALVEIDESELAAARTEPEQPPEQPAQRLPERLAEQAERAPEQPEQPDTVAREVADLRAALARAEERILGKDALLEELRRQLEHERRQNEWLRRPWWQRWLG